MTSTWSLVTALSTRHRDIGHKAIYIVRLPETIGVAVASYSDEE